MFRWIHDAAARSARSFYQFLHRRLGEQQRNQERLAQLRRDLAAAHRHIETLSSQAGQVSALWRPPGHYFSPITDAKTVLADAEHIWPEPAPAQLPGIEFNDAVQFEWVDRVRHHRGTYPDYLPDRPLEGHRFYHQNRQFSLYDGMVLHAMMCELKPRRIIEAGSGFSSAIMLDTNQHHLGGEVELVFIEPYTERLRSLLLPGDEQLVTVIEKPLQDVLAPMAKSLQANDILFIDSTHVMKTGSDVNHLLFEVLPNLAPGVHVHFHDIMYPFEYPRRYIEQGRSWNEAYGVRAFLMYNRCFEIQYFANYLSTVHPKRVLGLIGGSNLWLKRAADSVA